MDSHMSNGGVLCCRLWEVLWTGYPCTNFHLLVAVALLDTEKDTIMENKFGFTEILKVCVALYKLAHIQPFLLAYQSKCILFTYELAN